MAVTGSLFALYLRYINPTLWGFQWALMTEGGGNEEVTPTFVAFVPSCRAKRCATAKMAIRQVIQRQSGDFQFLRT